MIKNNCFYLYIYIWILFFIKFILLLISFSLIFINIFLFINKNIGANTKFKRSESISLEKIKPSDLLFLFFSNINYKVISNYLKSKFAKKSLLLNFNKKAFLPIGTLKINKKKKKKIRVFSVNMDDSRYLQIWLKAQLKEKFIIKFSSYKPDYLIYNICGNECSKPKYNILYYKY